MPTHFAPELGNRILELITRRHWNVCYEFRHYGEPGKYQSMEEVFGQVAETLEIGPRYHLFPSSVSFDEFSWLLATGTAPVPMVTIGGVRRIVFGFGLREDHCFFVTHTKMHSPTADRQPKDYEYMLDALDTLEECSRGHKPRRAKPEA